MTDILLIIIIALLAYVIHILKEQEMIKRKRKKYPIRKCFQSI